MSKNAEDPPSEQSQRLAAKTQDQRMVREFVEGAGLSPWAARMAVQTVHEVYFAEPTGEPLRAGQIRYKCVRQDQGAGKPLKECALTAVVLTLIGPADALLRAQDGADAHRRHVLARIAEEARDQGGLLTQEDLAQLLFTDVRTIRRDIHSFKEHGGVMIPTRGQQKDIGPTVTHKGLAVRVWIEEAKEPPQIARHMHRSLHAVERYLGHFARVVYLGGLGFDVLQTAFTIGISSALVRTYRTLYEQYKGQPGFKQRLAELKAIGEAHYEMADQKRGATWALPRVEQLRQQWTATVKDPTGNNLGPQTHKTFSGAREAFFASECPQLGGQRTRQVLVPSILGLVEQFFPSSTNLKAGQTVWTCIHKDETAAYGKRIQDCRLASVILDVVPPQEIVARAHGAPLRDLKVQACARLFDQAYAQHGVLTSAEVALLLKLNPGTVGEYIREYEQTHHRRLPRRGTVHDLGPTLTHKREILDKLVFDGLSVEEVCRHTDHSPEAVLRYALNFKQVLLCRRKKLTNAEIVYATRLSRRLVEEYQALIEEYARKHPRGEFDGQPELEALLDKLEAKHAVNR